MEIAGIIIGILETMLFLWHAWDAGDRDIDFLQCAVKMIPISL